jgi:hypothetical protein
VQWNIKAVEYLPERKPSFPFRTGHVFFSRTWGIASRLAVSTQAAMIVFAD